MKTVIFVFYVLHLIATVQLWVKPCVYDMLYVSVYFCKCTFCGNVYHSLCSFEISV